MRAVVKTKPGPGASLCSVPEPKITGSNQLLIQPVAVSICGTDLHIDTWDAWSSQRIVPPRIMGHEFAGTVVEVGSDVTQFKVGDYVSGESHWVCGLCYQCRSGQHHVCKQTRILGVDVDGCFADLVVIPQTSAWLNDLALPPEIACVQDPLGNAVHATLASDIAGRTVAILGCGPIGLFAAAVARACGASTIIATDTRAFRLELASTLGADVTVNAAEADVEEEIKRASGVRGVDVVLEMSGAPRAIQQAMRIARPGGSVSLMGIPAGPVELNMAEDMIFKGLTVHCIVGRRLYQTWDTMKSLLDSKQLDIRPAITHQLPLEEYSEGMRLMREGLCGKVVFRL